MFIHAISSVSIVDGPAIGGSAEDSDSYGKHLRIDIGNKWALTGVTFGREFATSSLKISTSSGLIHRDDVELRSSSREDPERNVLSTNFNELLPSIAASIENFSGGSSVSLYMHGGQRLRDPQPSSLPSALCTRASTSRNIAR